MTTPLFLEPDEDAEDLDTPTPEAPYGYTVDRETGEKRPKKRAGRPKVQPLPSSPALDDLRSRKVSDEEDTAPKTGTRKGLFGKPKPASPEPDPLPPFRAGPIAKGMNSLYRRAGKLIRIWDPEVGQAVVACTYKEDEDDTTVGEAWENLARTNPRIRAFLLKMLTGSAWGSLIMAHLPIFMAIVMKDSIRSKLPIDSLAGAFLTDENPYTGESEGSDLSAMLGNLSPEDASQMMSFAQGMMGQFMNEMPRNQNATRIPVEGDEA